MNPASTHMHALGEEPRSPAVGDGASAAVASPMRILSLWQPWASLWVAGAKLIETRSWGTSYRGPIAVHASKRWDDEQTGWCLTEPFRSVLAALGVENTIELPRGAILGVVQLTGCLKMLDGRTLLGQPGAGEMLLDSDPRLTKNERAFGNYAAGRFAWTTGEERHILAEPIPFRGAQGWRDLDPATAARLT